MLIFFYCLLLISCKENSSNNTSSSSSSSSQPTITYSFLDETGSSDEDGDSCFFDTDLSAKIKLIFSEESSNSLPQGIVSLEDVSEVFSCTNCGQLEIISLNSKTYEIKIVPNTYEYNDEIKFEVYQGVFKTQNDKIYNQPVSRKCIITNTFTSNTVEEPSTLAEMIDLDFSSIGEVAASSLYLTMPKSINQKCNSCVSWSSNYILSYYNWIANGSPINSNGPVYNNSVTSPYYAYTLRSNNPKTCQDKVTYDHVFNIFKTRGSATISSMPLGAFNAQDGTYPGVSTNYDVNNTFDINAAQSKILEVLKINSKSIHSIKGALFLGNPLAFSVKLSKNFDKIKVASPLWQMNNDVIYQSNGHALTLTGYDDNYNNTGEGAFKFLNSWGEAFGDQGSGWISYTDFLNIERVPGNYVFMLIPAAKVASSIAPVAKYTFENTLNSLTGSHNGVGQSISYVAGKSGQGIFFSGSSYVDLGSSFNFQEGYSVSLWVKPSGSVTAEQILISQVYGSDGLNSGFEVGIENNQIFTRSFDGALVEKSSTSISAYPVTLSWNHVVVTWDTFYIKTYLNNKLVNIKPLNSSISSNVLNKKMYLGRKALYSSNASYYLGSMDNLRIYQKAINDLDVKNLFEGGN